MGDGAIWEIGCMLTGLKDALRYGRTEVTAGCTSPSCSSLFTNQIPRVTRVHSLIWTGFYRSWKSHIKKLIKPYVRLNINLQKRRYIDFEHVHCYSPLRLVSRSGPYLHIGVEFQDPGIHGRVVWLE